MNNWVEIVAGLRPGLEERHQARETALASSRKIIQLSSRAIRHVHRKDLESARKLLDEAGSLSHQARQVAEKYPEVLYAGYLQDADKERTEAHVLIAIVCGETFPTPCSIGVEVFAYLNGVAEAASEARRTLLDMMRRGEMANAEKLLTKMELLYEELITIDYPDGLSGGLRRTCDATRAVIERSRSDLTMTIVQTELRNEIVALRKSD